MEQLKIIDTLHTYQDLIRGGHSSFLMRYSVLHQLNTLDVGRNRSMCGVIVVDAESFRSTCHGRDAYMHNHCLVYLHNYLLFYQLLDSNLFTHHNTCHHERSHLVKPMAPGSIFHIIFSDL